jgi:transcriptional regulator with XRE-family HTH domain
MRKHFSYIRAHRRKWGLSQVELARLVGLATCSAMSRIERAERVPTTATIVACSIVFGLAAPDLFPSLHEEVERSVRLSAKQLHAELAGQTDKASLRKRALLMQVVERTSSHKKPNRYEPNTKRRDRPRPLSD